MIYKKENKEMLGVIKSKGSWRVLNEEEMHEAGEKFTKLEKCIGRNREKKC